MEFVTKYSDVFLAVMVVSVVGLMIVPLPTWLIDVLLTFNVSLGITVLLAVLYISQAIRLAAFPSILLLATLFRLGLNVSTTRLILLQGDAGEMVHAFGNFVVRGNIIVGAIVFLILTLINFIVISKGSERVAEVSARFTLDAMPGKQMAIDADMRAGAYDLEEAMHRRRQLARESQLFGAMDGAMKFVKGDAIAGILITLVNIIGGVSIGIVMKGMDGAQAIQHFGLLTIGDGLLSQIPALILSAAAGLMVTRVEPERRGDNMGHDIVLQLVGNPKALGIMACVLLIMGLIPGLPVIPFMLIALLAGSLAGWMVLTGSEYPLSAEPESGNIRADTSGERSHFSIPAPITLNFSSDLTRRLNLEDPQSVMIVECIPRIRQEVYGELGVRIPSIRIRGFNDELPQETFSIWIYDIPVYQGTISSDTAFVTDVDEKLQILAGKYERVNAAHPCTGA
nr:flagellar biosynthesis protein FlhA [bacterium]